MIWAFGNTWFDRKRLSFRILNCARWGLGGAGEQAKRAQERVDAQRGSGVPGTNRGCRLPQVRPARELGCTHGHPPIEFLYEGIAAALGCRPAQVSASWLDVAGVSSHQPACDSEDGSRFVPRNWLPFVHFGFCDPETPKCCAPAPLQARLPLADATLRMLHVERTTDGSVLGHLIRMYGTWV